MADVSTHRARRELIRHLLKTRPVATQEELGALLKREGIEVTQATLSRDLAKLHARRSHASDGSLVYELDDSRGRTADAALMAVHQLVTTVDDSDAMVVIRTLPGAASVVAAALDAHRPEGILGTLAGDDTVFIVPARGVKPARVTKDLLSVWKKGITS